MKLEGKLWLDINGLGTASAMRVKLLEMIGETGSINKAAQAVGMSYKAAWDNINSLNEIYGKDLVERKTGGKGGGGTILTPHGKDLVKTYNHYSRIHELYLTDIAQMNSIEAKVTSVSSDGYCTAITSSGDSISCILLDTVVSEGSAVTIFVKPTDIILINSDNFEASAKNLYKTKVKTIASNDGKSDIILTTEKGTTMTVRITTASTERLKLKKGTEIYALFKTASALAALK